MVIAIAELTEEKRDRGVPQLTHISFHRPHLFILNIFIVFESIRKYNFRVVKC